MTDRAAPKRDPRKLGWFRRIFHICDLEILEQLGYRRVFYGDMREEHLCKVRCKRCGRESRAWMEFNHAAN